MTCSDLEMFGVDVTYHRTPPQRYSQQSEPPALVSVGVAPEPFSPSNSGSSGPVRHSSGIVSNTHQS